MRSLPRPTAEALTETIERALDTLADAEDDVPKIKGLTVGGVSRLPFVDTVEALLIDFAKVVGYTESGALQLARDARVRFPTNFKLAEAVRYAKQQRAFVRRCFTDDALDIDNGAVERRFAAAAGPRAAGPEGGHALRLL